MGATDSLIAARSSEPLADQLQIQVLRCCLGWTSSGQGEAPLQNGILIRI